VGSSENAWDWLGHGLYFWETSPLRALEWAQPRPGSVPGVGASASTGGCGAVIQLGRCFDLTDVEHTRSAGDAYVAAQVNFRS